MEPLRIERLPPEQYGLLQRFYRTQRAAMRVKDASQAWVLRDVQIRAGLCLRQVAGGHWLTGLLVDAGRRRSGLASRLLAFVRDQVPGPLWLFCDPALGDFYRARGFHDCTNLPPALAARFARQARSKPLQALCSNGSGPCAG